MPDSQVPDKKPTRQILPGGLFYCQLVNLKA